MSMFKRYLHVGLAAILLMGSTTSCTGPSSALTLIAGNTRGLVNGSLTQARYASPVGIVTGATGNMYVLDGGLVGNGTVRALNTSGTVSTVAGTPWVFGSTDGHGSAASFNLPNGFAIDKARGVFYVADMGNRTVRKVTSAGTVTTLAGSAGVIGSADGTGSAASFNNLTAITTDPSGNVIVVDGSSVRTITPAGVVTTLAGVTVGAGGITTDKLSNIYAPDSTGTVIQKISPTGSVTTFAGALGVRGTADGTGTNAQFASLGSSSTGMTSDSNNNIYIIDGFSIRKISNQGVVTTLGAINDPTQSATTDSMNYIVSGMTTDAAGNVYLSSASGAAILKFTLATGLTSVFSGQLQYGHADGQGLVATFAPGIYATSGGGNLYVADQYNNTIRKIDSTGLVSTLAGSVLIGSNASGSSVDGTGSAAQFNQPGGLAIDRTNQVIYVIDSNSIIRKVTYAGVVTTFVGTSGVIGAADGTGAAASFNNPTSLAVDSTGNVYVADSWNYTIRKITPAGVVTTLAGSVGVAGSTDGMGTQARFGSFGGMAVDASGNVYVSDSGNLTIRKITPTGVVTTLAGAVTAVGSGTAVDGTGSQARFYTPGAMAIDGTGTLYVGDCQGNQISPSNTGDCTVRKVTPAGVVTTTAAKASLITSITVAEDGTIYITSDGGVYKAAI